MHPGVCICIINILKQKIDLLSDINLRHCHTIVLHNYSFLFPRLADQWTGTGKTSQILATAEAKR